MSNQYTEQTYYQSQYGGQQQQQPANNKPTGGGFNKKIILIIAVVVMGILALGLLTLLLFRGGDGDQPVEEEQYMFLIDGSNVPQDEFEEIYAYYIQTEESEEEALERAKNTLIDNYVLREEYFARGHTLNDLSDAMLQIPPSGSDAPSSLKRITRENTAISETLSTEIGVESRSGNIIEIRISESDPEQKSQLTALATRKLLMYRGQLIQDTPFTEVKNAVENDAELVTQSAVMITAGEFTNISRARLPLPGENFKNALFNTPVGRVSNIFSTETGDKSIYGIVQVTDSKEGEYSGYQQWFSSAKGNIIVEFDYQQENE